MSKNTRNNAKKRIEMLEMELATARAEAKGKNTFLDDMVTIHDDGEEYGGTCKKCNTYISDFNRLKIHMFSMHGFVICKKCQCLNNSWMVMSKMINIGNCNCINCDKPFIGKKALAKRR